jgi:hypothetical protein
MLTIVKKNDSYDVITYQLENEDNSPIDLTGATVNFVMGKKNKLITNAQATITSATSGIVSYQLSPSDTLVSGTFLAEFVVTFANGTQKTYPSNGYITVDIEQNLDTTQNNVVVDTIAAKQGDFEAKLDSILKQGIGTPVSAMNEYTWITTSGQTVFIFPTNAKYDPSAKWFQVLVGNVPVDTSLVNRLLTTQFSLNIDPATIKAGMSVRAMWVEPIVPITSGHHTTHEINGQDEINIKNLRGFKENVTDISYNVKLSGAVGDGIVDDTASIIAAESYAFSLGPQTKLVMNGTFKTTSKIKIRCQLDATQATINYYGTGTALVIGDDSATGIVTAYKRFELPRVIKMNRVTGWDGTSEGVKCVNLNTCEVYVPFVQDFEKGLIVYGSSQGSAYNNFHLGALWENHKNIVLDGDATGWVNQNNFFGGRLQLSLTKGAVIDDVNACLIDMSSPIQPNNNTFVGTSLEGANIAYNRLDISGRFNVFYNCRWESQSSAIVRVRYRSTAVSNAIHYGYDSTKIVETFDTGATGGEIRDTTGAYTSAFNTSGQIITTAVLTDINSWNAPVSRRITYDATTGQFTPRSGRWKISATISFTTGNATGRRYALLTCAGSSRDFCEVVPHANRVSMKVEDVYKFDGTQTFKFSVYQSSGADLALETTSGYVRMQAEYLGY